MVRKQDDGLQSNSHITDRFSGRNRRSFLKILGMGAVATSLGHSTIRTASGASDDPFSYTKSVVLDGGYPDSFTESEAAVDVRSSSEFLDAVTGASSGDIVFVPSDAEIDLSGEGEIDVPGGVTIASDRGANGSAGGLLFTDVKDNPLFQTDGEKVRLSGLRLRGNHPEGYHEFTDWDESAAGLQVEHTGCEVDNCEIFGWGYAGVAVRADGCHVHHCHIHDNEEDGLGYGVHCGDGHTTIEFNYFLHNRHAIAGGGDTAGYTARYNLVGPEADDHAFDMHEPGGDRIIIHHNKFEYDETFHGSPIEAVKIRGVPNDICEITENWFHHDSPPGDEPTDSDGEAINQSGSDGEWKNLTFSSNYYGPDAVPDYDSSFLEEKDPVGGTSPSDDSTPSRRSFEIRSTPDSSGLVYEFTVDGKISQAPDDVENNDDVTDNGDGTWTATGSTGNGYSDTYEFAATVVEFTASPEDEVSLYDDGTDVTGELLGSEMTGAIRFDGNSSETESTYSFGVSETISAGPGTTLEDADVISGDRVEGTIGDDTDIYHYKGDLLWFDFDGAITVSVEELD